MASPLGYRIGSMPELLARTRTCWSTRHGRGAARFLSTVAAGCELCVAVVGSGPAGFYTSLRIMSQIPDARVDMYEALPAPFGLVRYGVAPDHSEVKNCQDRFREVATSARFNFIGNVEVGGGDLDSHRGGVELSALRRNYHAVVLAYGASRDRTLGIPGESTMEGVYSARQFVGWYNGLPEFSNLSPNLSGGEDVVIIGHGNVALDVARILLANVDDLRRTDITEEALDVLSGSRLKRVHVVGRRGPMQASFTIKEVRELMNIPHVAFHDVDRGLLPADLSSLPRPKRRLMEVISRGSGCQTKSVSRSWSLDFCLSPKRFLGRTEQPARVSSTVFERMALDSMVDPASKSWSLGGLVEIPSSVVFRSTGYKSAPLTGFEEARIGFDKGLGIVRNDGLGRVLAMDRGFPGCQDPVAGVYCAGWVKRGPTGVIATTMQDAFATADTICQDWVGGRPFLNPHARAVHGWAGVRHDSPGLAKVRTVSWSDWEKIDSTEEKLGRARGKERTKFTSTSKMLSVLD